MTWSASSLIRRSRWNARDYNTICRSPSWNTSGFITRNTRIINFTNHDVTCTEWNWLIFLFSLCRKKNKLVWLRRCLPTVSVFCVRLETAWSTLLFVLMSPTGAHCSLPISTHNPADSSVIFIPQSWSEFNLDNGRRLRAKRCAGIGLGYDPKRPRGISWYLLTDNYRDAQS